MTPSMTPTLGQLPSAPERTTLSEISYNASVQQARLAVLHELEASLKATQKALLTCDVAELDEATREQVQLHQSLATFADSVSYASEADPELRLAEKRVLGLGRLQIALLTRARRSLKITANLVARTQGNYAPEPPLPPIGPSRTVSVRNRVHPWRHADV